MSAYRKLLSRMLLGTVLPMVALTLSGYPAPAAPGRKERRDATTAARAAS
jgi:hypothetical protein